MLSSVAKRVRSSQECLRWYRTSTGPPRTRRPSNHPMPRPMNNNTDWWIVDGEMHEVGENVPRRERFVLPQEIISNRRRKQLRHQFMRRTRLVLKDSDHESWCTMYLELYQELRDSWEKLYWDEGYSRKIANDYANYESDEDDDRDFNPYRGRSQNPDQQSSGRELRGQGDPWSQENPVRNQFEQDRERRMRERAFAPMRGGPSSDGPNSFQNQQTYDQQFNVERYFPRDD